MICPACGKMVYCAANPERGNDDRIWGAYCATPGCGNAKKIVRGKTRAEALQKIPVKKGKFA